MARELRATSTLTIPLPRIAADAFVPYTNFVVVAAMLFGGGARQGLWSDVIVELAALPLFAWAMFRIQKVQLSRSALWGIVLLCAILTLPILQLIPLPPQLWRNLPGRENIASVYTAAGMALPWLPLSLDPTATWRGLLALIPAAAVFVAMLSIAASARRVLIASILIVAFVSVPLGLAQLMGGPDSSLRFYTITNNYSAVGFFANTNHNAAFLFCSIPFAAALGIGLVRDRSQYRIIGGVLVTSVLAVCVIGLAVIHQRAGLSLGFVAGVACMALIWRHRHGRSVRRLMYFGVAANLIGILLAFQFGFTGLADKLEHFDVVADMRWPVARITWQAASIYLPFGSGFGTFLPIYDMTSPRSALLLGYYVNHAHDDWLELWLTGSVPAALVAGAFLVWFFASAYRLWRHDQPETKATEAALAQAASIVIVLLLLHSTVDYPLRTAAMSVFFAIACGFLIRSGQLKGERPADPPAAVR